MSTEMAQMNTRISRSLKERGDAALEKAGMTPSQAVRKLWDFAARNSHNPQIIQSLFDTEDEAEKREAEEERARRRAVALKARISLPTRTNELGSSLRSGRRTRRTPRCASTP